MPDGHKGSQSRTAGWTFFLMGGLILSAAVGVLYLLMTGADVAMYLLGEKDEFLTLADISPTTVPLILARPLLPILKILTRPEE